MYTELGGSVDKSVVRSSVKNNGRVTHVHSTSPINCVHRYVPIEKITQSKAFKERKAEQ